MNTVERAAEVIRSMPPGHRGIAEQVGMALHKAGLLCPDWATDEANAVLDALVIRSRPSTAHDCVENNRRWLAAVDAYLASVESTNSEEGS